MFTLPHNSLHRLNSKGQRLFKESLFAEQKGCCHWCKNLMIMRKSGDRIPDNYATFEHLVDDWACADGKDNTLDKIKLACSRCNHVRNTHRHRAALSFYRSKFANIREFHEFSIGKRPGDFIRLLGHWEQFTVIKEQDII